MSSSKDVGTLLSLFGEQSIKQSFEWISSSFGNLEKRSYYHVGPAIVLLLRSRDVLVNQPQYLIGYFLLWELGRNETETNPFMELICGALTASEPRFGIARLPALDQIGRTFLSQLVTQSQLSKDLLRKSPLQVYQEACTDNNVDLSSLIKLCSASACDLPFILRCGISGIVPFEDGTLRNDRQSSDDIRTSMEALLLGDNAPVRRSLRPEWWRLQPPLHSFGTTDELIWINPGTMHGGGPTFVWETSTSSSEGEKDDVDNCGDGGVVELMRAAKSGSLMPPQVAHLVSRLRENPDILQQVEFCPEELPLLVERNPAVAVDVLLIVFDTDEIPSYLKELLTMDVSLQSLEVVNQLTTSVELPVQFINQYIDRCIASCHSSPDRMMHRLVRLVCVFFQSLIRNKIVEVKEIQTSMINLCLQFNSIKEANALFKLIKSMNGGPAPDVD